MTAHQVRHNIRLYWWLTVFGEPLFWGAVLISALQQLGHMTLADIFFMEAVVVVVCVVLDLPMGALADYIGHKPAVVTGRMFLLASTIAFAFMTSPLWAWIANVCWAIGLSLHSGADSALLYGTLKSRNIAHVHTRIVGRAIGGRLLMMGFGSLATGVLATYHMRFPLLLSIPFACIPLYAATRFVEPPRVNGRMNHTHTPQQFMREHIALLKRGIGIALNSVELRWMIGFATLLTVTSKVWFFTYNPYFEVVQLPLYWYGVIFFCANIIAWSTSHFADRAEKYLGEHTCVVGMVIFLGVPITLMGLFPSQLLAWIVLAQNIVRGFMQPFINDYMNRHITDESVRATVLSVRTSVGHAIEIIALTVLGVCITRMTLPATLIALGITVLALGTVTYRTYRTRIMR